MDHRSVKNICAGTLAFSLFFSGAHPGLIIGSMYFFTIMAITNLHKNNYRSAPILNLVLLACTVIITLAGMIYSYAEIIPLFTRSGKIPAAEISFFSTPANSFFSLVLPLPYTKTGGEITMHNIYAGLLVLVSVIAGIITNRKSADLYLPATAAFFLLLSTNFPLSLWLIGKLPLLQYIRLNGELRIFAILPLILYGVIQLEYLLSFRTKFLRNSLLILAGILLAICMYSIVLHPQALRKITAFPLGWMNSNDTSSLKYFLHSLGFADAVILQSIVQVAVLLLMAWAVIKKQRWLTWIVAADLILATLFNLPFTGVSMRPVSEIQAALDKSLYGLSHTLDCPRKRQL